MFKTNCKKVFSIFLALCMLMSVVPMMSFTASAEVGDIFTYEYNLQTLKYTILTEDDDGGTVSVKCNSWDINGIVTIPSSVPYSSKTYTVTKIEKQAFYYSWNITGVTIPDSVTTIGEGAFGACRGLEELTIPNSVTTIESYAFSGCSSLTELTIPNSVKTIGEAAFSYCTENIKVDAGNPYFIVENGVLYNKDKTTLKACFTATGDYTVASTVKKIENSAFSGCSGLTSVTISDSVTTIGDFAFNGCGELTTVNIGNSVETIGRSAFAWSQKLTTVNIGNSVEMIGYGAFEGCTGLTEITIPNSVEAMGDSVFAGCSGLTTVNIGNSVTTIAKRTFEGCSELTTVNIGNSVKTIEFYAFSGCEKLTTVTIPASVELIDDCAFGTVDFSNVTFIGDELPSMRDDSFKYGTINITEDTLSPDSNVKVKIVGFKNDKPHSEDEPFWRGELLKPVVTGYTGTDTLYYRFKTNDSVYVNFYTSDTARQVQGNSVVYLKDEAYAAIGYKGVKDYIKCEVFTISKDSETGKFTAKLLAETEQELTGYISDDNTSVKKEFETANILVMQQGDSKTVKELFASAGFTHICDDIHFNSVNTAQYEENALSVKEITDGDGDTMVTALTDKTGLSKLTFDFYSDWCDYHGETYSKTKPLKVTAYVYVMPKPEFTVTKNSITVADNTPAPATSNYRIGFGETKKTFTGLNKNIEYDILQTVEVKVGEDTYTGVYHNYIKTLTDRKITTNTTETYKEINNGYITIDKALAILGDMVTVKVYPNDGYSLDTLTYKGKCEDDENATEITAKDNVYSFTMPNKNVEINAKFVPHTHDFSYEADNDTITATCTVDGCGLTDEKVSITLNLPENLTYSGKDKGCTLAGVGDWTAAGLAAPTVNYAKKGTDGNYGEATETKPVDAGAYKAIITLTAGGTTYTAEKEFTIEPKELTVDGTTVSDKKYDGKDTATVTANGTLVDVEAVDNGKVEIDAVTATFNDNSVNDSKTVTVVYTLKGEKAGNYKVKNTTITAKVEKNEYTAVGDIKAEADEITNRAITLKPVAVGIEGAEVYYKVNDGEWQESPEFTGLTADTKYNFFVKVAETQNYNEYISGAYEFTTLKENKIQWIDDDGTVLYETVVAEGETPVYKGKTPVKADDNKNIYKFKGWDKEIDEATGNATYKAVFEATYCPVRKVVFSLKNVVLGDGCSEEVRNGSSYTVTFVPTDGNKLPDEISIVVGATQLTAKDYTYNNKTGVLVIKEGVINDEVTITVIAKSNYDVDSDSDSDSDSNSDSVSKDENFFTRLINWFKALFARITGLFA